MNWLLRPGCTPRIGVNDYFSHTSLDGREFNQRILDAGYDYNRCTENIAAGHTSPESVVNAWMASDGHRANILSPEFCDIGVGYAAVSGSSRFYYWTQDFGRHSGVTQCPPANGTHPLVAPTTKAATTNGSGGGGGCFITSCIY